MARTNPYTEALKEPANLIGFATLAATSLAVNNPLPVLCGIVVEAAYLLFVPETKWYRDRLTNRGQSKTSLAWQVRRDQVLSTLRPDLQSRFRRLEIARAQIDTKVRSQVSFKPEMLDKLDQLLLQFLDFCATETTFRTYLSDLIDQLSVNDGARPQPIFDSRPGYIPPQYTKVRNYDQQYYASPEPLAGNVPKRKPGSDLSPDNWVTWAVNQIQLKFNAQLNQLNPESETDPALKELKQKRADVLSRRNDHVAQMGKAIVNLDLQVQLIEDTFGLINDEVSTRNPDQVIGEIDSLMLQTETLTKTLQEIGQFDQVQAGLSAG